MRESIDVPVPGRKWALCAIEDLRREGLEAELLGCLGDDGPWTVRVSGPAETINEIRVALEVPAKSLSWESFINAAITS